MLPPVSMKPASLQFGRQATDAEVKQARKYAENSTDTEIFESADQLSKKNLIVYDKKPTKAEWEKDYTRTSNYVRDFYKKNPKTEVPAAVFTLSQGGKLNEADFRKHVRERRFDIQSMYYSGMSKHPLWYSPEQIQKARESKNFHKIVPDMLWITTGIDLVAPKASLEVENWWHSFEGF